MISYIFILYCVYFEISFILSFENSAKSYKMFLKYVFAYTITALLN